MEEGVGLGVGEVWGGEGGGGAQPFIYSNTLLYYNYL
jgi:hypothetical protein